MEPTPRTLSPRGTEDELPDDETATVARIARDRIARWPRIDPVDTLELHGSSGRYGQRFAAPGTPGEPGDHVFVINLPHRRRRLTSVLTQLRLADVGATIVTGVSGNAFASAGEVRDTGFAELPGYRGAECWPFPTSLGECGCFLSHWMLWQRCVEQRLPAMLVLEDDVELPGVAPGAFRQAVGRLLGSAAAAGEAWDMLILHWVALEEPVRGAGAATGAGVTGAPLAPAPGLVEPGWGASSLAYVVTCAGAAKLLGARGLGRALPVDVYFNVLNSGLRQHYAAHPHAPRFSDQADAWIAAYADAPPLRLLAAEENICCALAEVGVREREPV